MGIGSLINLRWLDIGWNMTIDESSSGGIQLFLQKFTQFVLKECGIMFDYGLRCESNSVVLRTVFICCSFVQFV